MNIVCIICRDLMIPSDNIFFTRCGHVFHFPCLSQWLDRSKSCPECREKTTQSRIHKLFFTVTNNETASGSSSLQERIDGLNFQILLNEKNIKYYISKNAILEKQNAGLRQEVRKVESEINQKNADIYALKEQVKCSKEKCLEFEVLKRKLCRTKKEMEELRYIQTLLRGSIEDVDEIIGKTKDYHTLVTYISVMKKRLVRNISKRKQLFQKLKKLKHRLMKLRLKYDYVTLEKCKRWHFQERLISYKQKNFTLKKRIIKLENLVHIASK